MTVLPLNRSHVSSTPLLGKRSSAQNGDGAGDVIAQGDVCWADLGRPRGSEPAWRRPVVVVQGNAFNRSRIGTVVCVPLTSNLTRADAPGNALLNADLTGLPKDSVANVSRLVTLDRRVLSEAVGRLPESKLRLVLAGIDVVLGR